MAHIHVLDSSHENNYEDFLNSIDASQIYFSNKYRELLKNITNAEDRYLIAVDQNKKVLGVLPLFIKKSNKYGTVVNSLPFFGSHGGVLCFENKKSVKESLIEHYLELVKKERCISATIISHLSDDIQFYEKNVDYSFKDNRIGQLTQLIERSESLSEDLINLFHQKTRNVVRKALKSGLAISNSNHQDYWDYLIHLHKMNSEELNVPQKPEVFFELVRKNWNDGEDYQLYTALKDNQPVASLLVLYFQKTVEYFVPAYDREYKALQPLSLLIYKVMIESCERGFKWWNWGGTQEAQKDLYRFKHRWGAIDRPYYYFTTVYDQSILKCSKETLLNEYPHFYVVPFHELENP